MPLHRNHVARLVAAVLAVGSIGIVAVPAIARDNPLAKKADPKPFVGEFAGDNVKLSLTFDSASKSYRGEVAIGDAKYPCTATDSADGLAGKFTVDAQTYAFTASFAGDALTLTSDGNAHALKRVAIAKPINPLAGDKPAKPGNPPAPPANNAPKNVAGGVGIGFEPTDDGLVIRALMPGGAGEHAKLKLGGILRAIEGEHIDKMSPDQIRSKLAGEPGSLVTITIEYPDEVTDAILERTALSQPGQPQPAQPQNPQAPRPNDPHAAAGIRPLVAAYGPLKPGLRVTYYIGSASIPGARTTLVQDDQGNWIDPTSGQRFAEADNPSSAGAGIMQLTVVAADERDLAVDARNFVYMDIQQGLAVTTSYGAYTGSPEGLGEFWQPPAKLAAMREGDEGGQRIRRCQYPVDGKTFNAIAITNIAGGNGTYSRNVFDLETGILIAASSSTTGAGQLTPNPNGTASPAAGVTTITSQRLLGIREVATPWINQTLPAWAKANTNLDYAGTYENLIDGAPAIAPWKLQARLSLGDARGSWMPLKQFSRLDTGMGGPPQDGQADRALGAGTLDPIWIDPQALAQLKPNSVLDEDAITKRRTTFLGTQNNLAVFCEDAPYEKRTYGYDTRTGTLSMVDNRQKQGPATIISKLQLMNQP